MDLFLIIAALYCIAAPATASVETPGVEQIAGEIADPYNARFRQYLTAQEAIDLSRRIPPISFPSPSTKRAVSKRVSRSYNDDSVSKKRDTCADNGLVTPDCIRQVYDIDYVPQSSRVTFAVYATEAATYNPSDLQSFLQQYRPEAQGATYDVIGSGDASEPSNVEAQFEVALDTQTLLGTAWPAQGQLYNLGGVFGPNPGQPYEPFVDFLRGLYSNETIPSVVSFSESIAEDQMDPDYARTLCTMMALVGARGVSLLFSSGDNGANGDTSGGTHRQVFEADFPASCPWVTAVGGTTNIANETAAASSTIPAFDLTFYTASGGGFSQLFDTPAYQKDVVDEYTVQHVPSSYANVSGYNAQGRGVPDLAAFSTNVPVVVNGVSLPLGGTSASTPLWAAVITLLNDYEASQGRPPLGFLNPWLYALNGFGETGALHDITTGGNNKGACDALSGCNLTETLGYDVAVGWDPVTGLGSPVFSSLIQALDNIANACE